MRLAIRLLHLLHRPPPVWFVGSSLVLVAALVLGGLIHWLVQSF